MGPCDVKVCRICFAMDCQLHLLHENIPLYKGYEAVTGLILADEEDLPRYLCTSCADRLLNFARFRNRTLRAHLMLLDIRKNHDHISVESIQDVIKAIHGDTDSEEGRTLEDVKIETKPADIPIDTIATQLRDEIETECKADDVGADDLVGDEAVAPCRMETNAVVKEDVFDETSVKNDDDSLRRGEDGLDDGLPSEQEDNLNTVATREGTEVNEQPIQNAAISCDLCGYENDDETQFFSHLRAHAENTLRRSNGHDYKTESEETKTPHTTLHIKFMCVSCGQSFSNQKQLTDHLCPQLDKDLSCDICKKTFLSKRNVNRHKLLHSSDRQYSCEMCKSAFTRKDHLKFHMQKHSRDAGYMCNICKTSFSTKYFLNKHRLHIHSEYNHHSCGSCKESFRSKSELNRHKLVHSDDKICKKTFSTKFNLNNHMAIHTDNNTHKCDICETTFRSRRNLKRHVLIHTIDKKYSCEVCDSSFRRKDNLKVHMQLHSRDKLYTCDECHKSVPTRSALINHMRGHASVKQYTCNICKKSFRHKSNYNSHLLIHTDDKPYSCDICQKSFRSKNDVKRHMVVHYSKVFKCKICKTSFSHQSSLKRHMLVHSDHKQYSCDFCKKSFRLKGNLQRHVTRIHCDNSMMPAI